MPHLLKIRLDAGDSAFTSMLDAGPLVGESFEWGTFGPQGTYRAAGDVRYVREENLRVGDHVVVRERQTSDEIYIVAVLEVIGFDTAGYGNVTPRYRMIERFDGSQPLARLRAESSDLAALPHFDKNAKGMMLRALTELKSNEFDIIVSAARASVRNGLRSLWPQAAPNTTTSITVGDTTHTVTSDDAGYFPIDFIESTRSVEDSCCIVPALALGQIPTPSEVSIRRLLGLLSSLHGAGPEGRADLLQAWRTECDDPDLDLCLILRTFRPASGIRIRQFDLCGIAFESEEEITIYPTRDTGAFRLARGAMRGFLRSSEGVPKEEQEFLDFAETFLSTVDVWLPAD